MGRVSVSLGLLVVLAVVVIGLAQGEHEVVPDTGEASPAKPRGCVSGAHDLGAAVANVANVANVRTATAAHYDVRDSAGNTMDTAKIIPDPAGGYLAVYHFRRAGVFTVGLARSRNLRDWAYLRDLATHASQPYLSQLADGGFLVAWETDTAEYTYLSFRYYGSRARLLAGRADRSFDASHTQVPPWRYAEGTPHIDTATLAPDIDHSRIEVGFHYFRDGVVDRQARGILRDFTEWTTRRHSALDMAIKAHEVTGNIGDRDIVGLGKRRYTLVEAQRAPGEFASWRIFLWDQQAHSARELTIRTHRGSSAFANPSITAMCGPDGRLSLVVGLFIPREGAAPGEAGQLIYHRRVARGKSGNGKPGG